MPSPHNPPASLCPHGPGQDSIGTETVELRDLSVRSDLASMAALPELTRRRYHHLPITVISDGSLSKPRHHRERWKRDNCPPRYSPQRLQQRNSRPLPSPRLLGLLAALNDNHIGRGNMIFKIALLAMALSIATAMQDSHPDKI